MPANPATDLPQHSEAMSISLENILPSLAKSLYGEDWRISIRELLQNAHDALAERPPNVRDELRIDIIPDLEKNTLTFRDAGIGMTLEDVKNYLATVGYGRKREQIEKLKKQEGSDREALKKVIGQYGIGFLSSFIIAARVEVRTQSILDPKSTGIRAVFTGETKWYHEACVCDPGTSVTVTLRTDAIVDPVTGQRRSLRELLAFAQLVAEVRRFGDLLPFPIYVHRQPGDTHPELANSTTGPWEKSNWNQEQLFAFLSARRPGENTPLWAAPFKFTEASDRIAAEGFLYVPNPPGDQGPSNQSVARAEMFCRRMFISDDMSAVLPDWAKFVCAVVECPDLTPTLDRNNVVRHDQAFVTLRQAIGRRIIDELVLMATKNPANFSRFLSVHADRLYIALAESWHGAQGGTEPDSFFGKFIKHLPFTVMDRNRPQGQAMTIPELIEEVRKFVGKSPAGEKSRPSIYYLGEAKAWGQFRAMILQKGYPVIIPTTNAEPVLIRYYGQTFPDEAIFDEVREVLDLYVEKVDQAPYELLKHFLKQLDGAGPDEVHVSKFQPASVPAMMTLGAHRREGQAQALEHFLQQAASVLDAKTRHQMEKMMETSRVGREFVTVTLNASNPVIDKLRQHCQNGRPLDGLVADVLHEIYHNARALSDPNSAVSEHYFEHRTALLGRSLDLDLRLNEVESSYEAAKQQLESVRREQSALVAPLQPISCAMLATDLRGSTNMVGFLDAEKSADLLRRYADELTLIVRKHNGRVEKFTGDGVFAWFSSIEGDPRRHANDAANCAAEINAFTVRFFQMGDVINQLVSASVTIKGARTVLHFGEVRFGGIAGTLALVGRQVVLLFRALAQKDLFDKVPIIMSAPFKFYLHAAPEPQLIAEGVRLDEHLPATDFYAHPAVLSASAGNKMER
jgi:HSP90 family molecular chaperone/class 3 adenylate cyclase